MICKNCKASILDDSMFCPSCGQKVEAEPVGTSASAFSSAFRKAGSLDGSDSGIDANAAERKPEAPQEDTGLRFSSGFKRADRASAADSVEEPAAAPKTSKWDNISGGAYSDPEATHTKNRCPHCGDPLDSDALFCSNCGAKLGEASTKRSEKRSDGSKMSPPQPPTHYGPALKFATNRSLVKMILLSLITFRIYPLVHQSRMADEINIVASRYDGKKTMPYFAMSLISPFTLGILTLVWNHNFANRIGNEARRREYNTGFGAKTFWLWHVLGSFIIVGPFIYLHKLCKTMNKINKSYNYYG